LLSRSPYGVPANDKQLVGPNGPWDLIADGYIFARQSLRGRFGFPLIDRNPQKYVDSIYAAREEDFIKATQRIAPSRQAPSSIVLLVLSL
jgi:predicted acyl esterase